MEVLSGVICFESLCKVLFLLLSLFHRVIFHNHIFLKLESTYLFQLPYQNVSEGLTPYGYW